VHEVPLSRAALVILERLPRFVGSDLVFTTTGTTPISGFGRVKERLDAMMGVSDWRFHDLRRTAASGMARIGVAPHVIGVAAVYNRHGYDAEKRDALDRWAEHVGRIRGNAIPSARIDSRPNEASSGASPFPLDRVAD
jgi:integrase